MTRRFRLTSCVMPALVVAVGFGPVSGSQPAAVHSASQEATITRVTITVGSKAFTATLVDNATAAALRTLLPLAVTMTELNGNEKLVRLSRPLPANESRPRSIQAGDLMLYGSSTLVLFYQSFPTTYSYTRIGRVDDPTGLEAALGRGDVAVVFEAASK